MLEPLCLILTIGRGIMTKNPSKKQRAIIVLNLPYGIETHLFTEKLITACQKENMAVFKVIHNRYNYDNVAMKKLIKAVNNQHKRVKVIIDKNSDNRLLHQVLDTVS